MCGSTAVCSFTFMGSLHAHAAFSTKERSRYVMIEELAPAAAARTGADADGASSSSQRRVFLAEPVAFYKLESGGSV
jgi:hypothetical protein